MTPREANYNSHSQPRALSAKRQQSTYVRFVTEHFYERNRDRDTGSACNSGLTRAPIGESSICNSRWLICVGVVSWGNTSGAGGDCLGPGGTRAGSNMSPKKYRLWTKEFPSTNSPSSPGAARQSNFLLIARNATPARRSVGSRALARHPLPRFAPSSRTSWYGLDDRRVA